MNANANTLYMANFPLGRPIKCVRVYMYAVHTVQKKKEKYEYRQNYLVNFMFLCDKMFVVGVKIT